MKKLIVIILIVLSNVQAFGNPDIDLLPKILAKELKRISENQLTERIDLMVPELNIQGKFSKLLNANNKKTIAYIYVGRVNSCRAGGCSIVRKHTNNDESEYFDYFIIFDTARIVKLVKVFDYQATHGQEVTAKGWLKQFIGYNGSKSLHVGSDVDAISGATISVYGITSDIEHKTMLLREMNW